MGKPDVSIHSFRVGNQECQVSKNMKALGIVINGNLSWDDHAEMVIQKEKG
jgi:hypothetical protein